MKKLLLILLLGVFIGCEGSAGPTGPSGPQGPTGPQGPQGQAAQFFFGTVIIDASGAATIIFPGLQVETSVVNCYIASRMAGPWLKVGNDLAGPFCGSGNLASGMFVAVFDAPPGWWFLATAAA